MSNRLQYQISIGGTGPAAPPAPGPARICAPPTILSSLLPCDRFQDVLQNLPSGFYKGEFVSIARSASAPLQFLSAGFKFKRAFTSYTIALTDKGWPSSASGGSAMTVKQIWEEHLKKARTGVQLEPYMMVDTSRDLATASSFYKSVSFAFDGTVALVPLVTGTIAAQKNSIEHGSYPAHLRRNTTDADQRYTFVEFQAGGQKIRWSLADSNWLFRNASTGVSAQWFEHNIRGKPNPVLSCMVVIVAPPGGGGYRSSKIARLFLNTQIKAEVAQRSRARLPGKPEGPGYS